MKSIERDVNGMTGKDRTGALIAMSGGVDSSVAAYLMQAEGYDCVGTTMRLYRNEDIGLGQFHTCCSRRDIDDASEVAFQLDLPYEVLDFTPAFRAQVIDRFVRVYEAGRDGRVDLDHLRALLREDTALVAVCAVDGELGTVQPIRAIAALLRDRSRCRLHVDATQAVGRTELALDGVDTMSIAPHKCGGINGSGLLVRRRGLFSAPLLQDGGTPALGLAAASEAALRLALTQRAERTAHVRALNGRLRAALARYPAVRLNSPEDAVPHILNVSVRGVKGTVFQRALAAHDVCVSVKSACATDGGPSRAVQAVVRDRRTALSSWRISLSHRTTAEEIAGFLARFDLCYKELVR